MISKDKLTDFSIGLDVSAVIASVSIIVGGTAITHQRQKLKRTEDAKHKQTTGYAFDSSYLKRR